MSPVLGTSVGTREGSGHRPQGAYGVISRKKTYLSRQVPGEPLRQEALRLQATGGGGVLREGVTEKSIR